MNYHLEDIDFTINTRSGNIAEHQINPEEWEVTLVDTGEQTMTGARVAYASRYIKTDHFLLTYGDGLADVTIPNLLDFHFQHKKLVTLTVVNMQSRFGNLELSGNQVSSFAEKKKINDEWINGGFMICEKKFLSYLSNDNSCILEQEPLKNVARDKQLMIYKHNGFWQCMDTYREQQMLEKLWQTNAPWKVWHDREKAFTPAFRESKHWSEQKVRAV